MKKILLISTAVLFTLGIFASQPASYTNAEEAMNFLRIIGGRAFLDQIKGKDLFMPDKKAISKSILTQRYDFEKAKNWADATKTDRWAKWQEALDRAIAFVRNSANKDEKLLKPLQELNNANNNLMNTLKTIWNGYILPALKAKKEISKQNLIKIDELTAKLNRENIGIIALAQRELSDASFKTYFGLSSDKKKEGGRDVLNALADILLHATMRVQANFSQKDFLMPLQAHYNSLNPL